MLVSVSNRYDLDRINTTEAGRSPTDRQARLDTGARVLNQSTTVRVFSSGRCLWVGLERNSARRRGHHAMEDCWKTSELDGSTTNILIALACDQTRLAIIPRFRAVYRGECVVFPIQPPSH